MIKTGEEVIRGISVGTVGYAHPEWSGTFYDADLPDDWRFLHYCNQFRSLLVSSDQTAEFLSGHYPELDEDGDPGFRFVFSLSTNTILDPNYLTIINKFNDLTSCVIALVVELFDQREPGNMDVLLSRLREFEAYLPLCLDAGPESDRHANTEALLQNTNASLVWRPSVEREPGQTGRYLVTKLGAASLTETRSVLQTCSRWMGGDRNAGIFFNQVSTSADQARECRILAEMMGV